MAIKEEKSKTWNDKPVRFKPEPYPIPNDPEAAKLFGLHLYVAPRGSGKSFAIAKTVQQYNKHGIRDAVTGKKRDQRTIIISPTVHEQPIFKALKADPSDIHTEYSDGLMTSILDDVDQERENSLKYHRDKAAWKKLIRHGAKALTEEERFDILARDCEPPEKPRFPNGPAVNHLILDDLQGSGAISSTGSSKLAQTLILNRHKGIVAYFAAQSLLSGVPKRIRENASNWHLWKQKRTGAEDEMADEVGIERERFKRLYNHALSTGNPHDFLNIDSRNQANPIFRRSFGTYLKDDDDPQAVPT